MAQQSLLVRALWFVFVGWWATPTVVNTAWLLNATVVLLPIGLKSLAPNSINVRKTEG